MSWRIKARMQLQHEHRIYYSGENVNGYIEYDIQSPVTVRVISAKIEGNANTQWYALVQRRVWSRGRTRYRYVNVLHTGHEQHVLQKHVLFGDGTGIETALPPGKLVCSFSFSLPVMIPSSFEGQRGNIRYNVSVTLERSSAQDQHNTISFTVICGQNLNANPFAREPIHLNFVKTFCCLCCASKPLMVEVLLPVSGYSPGQVIPIQVNVDNTSNVQLPKVKVSLRRVVKYRVTDPQEEKQTEEKLLVTVQGGPVPGGTTSHWNLELQIPLIPPAPLFGCKIIDLKYEFQVVLEVKMWYNNMVKRVPLFIGAIPLVGAGMPAAPATYAPDIAQASSSQPAVPPVAPEQPAQPSTPLNQGLEQAPLPHTTPNE